MIKIIVIKIKKFLAKISAFSIDSNLPGNSGQYFSVLKCDSENGLSLLVYGLLCVLDTPILSRPDSVLLQLTQASQRLCACVVCDDLLFRQLTLSTRYIVRTDAK